MRSWRSPPSVHHARRMGLVLSAICIRPGASAFFIVVYLHMFRGLIYGSYRKPRELLWVFGCMAYLFVPDGRRFFTACCLGPDVVLGRR